MKKEANVEVSTIIDGEVWTLALLSLEQIPRTGEIVHIGKPKKPEYEFLQVEHVIHRSNTKKTDQPILLLVSPAHVVPEGLR